jgi:hypothetical protein
MQILYLLCSFIKDYYFVHVHHGYVVVEDELTQIVGLTSVDAETLESVSWEESNTENFFAVNSRKT